MTTMDLDAIDIELPAGPFELPIDTKGLTIPNLRVVPATGEPYTVQALNPDLLLFEDTAAVHRWKGPADAPFRWLTFLAWAASRREGIIGDSVTWEVFAATTREVSDAGAAVARPTRPAPGTG